MLLKPDYIHRISALNKLFQHQICVQLTKYLHFRCIFLLYVLNLLLTTTFLFLIPPITHYCGTNYVKKIKITRFYCLSHHLLCCAFLYLNVGWAHNKKHSFSAFFYRAKPKTFFFFEKHTCLREQDIVRKMNSFVLMIRIA